MNGMKHETTSNENGDGDNAKHDETDEFELIVNRTAFRWVLVSVFAAFGLVLGKRVALTFHWQFSAATVAVCLTAAAASMLAIQLSRLLSPSNPQDDLIVKISRDGLSLGWPTRRCLGWDDIDSVNLIRLMDGLNTRWLLIVQPSGENCINHVLGWIGDKKARRLQHSLDRYRVKPEAATVTTRNEHDSRSWTGLDQN